MTFTELYRKLYKTVLPGIKYLGQSRVRRCQCCRMLSFIISFSEGEEFKLCIRCRANLRYEMLALALRKYCPDLSNKVIWEIDRQSPLSIFLGGLDGYIRSYYSPEDPVGFVNANGLRCEDITHSSFSDKSVDVIISSDVLEHVSNIKAAFSETARILKPGGFHLFTVPPRSQTIKRADIISGDVVLYTEPDYHRDPLNPNGILAYWDFGTDAIELFSESGLEISIVDGPKGKDRRLVWMARKPMDKI